MYKIAYKNIERLHRVVINSLARRDSILSYKRTLEALERLSATVSKTETDETVWYIGEDCAASLAAVIVGAFWFTADYYNGQSSVEYRVHCGLSDIFKPGMTNGVEPESSESDIYESLKLKAGY